MPKSRKIVWAENAVQDLLAIREYISLDSPERAEAWIDKLLEAGEKLSQLYERGRIVPEFRQKTIREILVGNYRLVYQINASSIEILTVFEGHRQLKK